MDFRSQAYYFVKKSDSPELLKEKKRKEKRDPIEETRLFLTELQINITESKKECPRLLPSPI
ncbi:hypothetical protein CXF74_03415 [Psychromonas sp. Urea-02u-13]|nr:hypothetical protein CXF74_03415 [Psychromonas sp. Urea-02u-13]